MPARQPLQARKVRHGLVHMNIAPDVSVATLLKLTVKKVRRGSVIYSDKFHSYGSPIFCGCRHLKVDHQKHFSSDRFFINNYDLRP